jgi:hypothetical protein
MLSSGQLAGASKSPARLQRQTERHKRAWCTPSRLENQAGMPQVWPGSADAYVGSHPPGDITSARSGRRDARPES